MHSVCACVLEYVDFDALSGWLGVNERGNNCKAIPFGEPFFTKADLPTVKNGRKSA